ncbi:MAG: caspase family protein [Nitrospirota bacterium]|nr:caspase family protein [Nitrospirota bacterium]
MGLRMMGKRPAKQAATSFDGVEVVFQTGHAGGIHALAVSANRRFIASSGSQDGTVKIWDVASGQEVRTLTGFDMLGADKLAFSDDNLQLITHEMTNGVKVFELASGIEVRAVGSIMSGGGQMSPDGRFAVTNGGGRGTAPAVFDLRTGKPVWNVPDDGAQQPLALSRAGRILVTSKIDTSRTSSLGSLFGFGTPSLPSMKREMLVWDVIAKKLRQTLPVSGTEAEGLDISPDGKLLAREQSGNRTIQIYELDTGKVIKTLDAGASGWSGMTNGLSFSPDGKALAFATSEGKTRLFDVATGQLNSSLQATAVNFTQDGSSLVLGPLGGGAPFLREVVSGKETRLAGGVSGVLDLAILPDSRSIIAGTESGSAKLWDMTTGQIVRTFDCPGGSAARSVAVSSTAPVLATACMDGSVWLWDLASGKQLRNLTQPFEQGQFADTIVRFTKDGRSLVVGVKDQLSLWDVATGKELRHIMLPAGPLPKHVAGTDNPFAAYEGLDPKLQAMMKAQASKEPATDRQSLEIMKEVARWVRALAVHPNGQLVAVGKSYETSLWDLGTGKEVYKLSGKTGRQGGFMPPIPNMPKQAGGGASLGARSGIFGGSLFPFGQGSQPATTQVPTMPMTGDLSDMMDMVSDGMEGARSLAFSPDGKWLLTDGTRGKALWDVSTGQKLRAPSKTGMQPGFDPMSMLGDMEFNLDGTGVAVSPDGRWAARSHGQVIKLWDLATGQDRFELTGHTSAVKSVAFSPDGRFMVSGGGDGAVRVWNLQTGKELAAFIGIGGSDFVTVTPDQYYRASKTRIKGVAFRVKKDLYPFEQFDLRFNRPDIVLARLGMVSQEVVQSYRLAYERRLKKMGLTEQMLGTDFHLPEVELLTKEVPVSMNTTTLPLRVKASDSKYALDRFNVFLNDVPVYGTAGLSLPSKQLQTHEQDIQVPLVPGRNKVQISVLNQQGVESLKQTVYTSSTAQMAPPEVYVVGIGVSEYKDKAYNLRYAAKDANDLVATYKAIEQRQGTQSKIHVLSLTDQKATKSDIMSAKEWLKQSKINDLVVVFAAGHGMTDEKSDYYFGTHDIDPGNPATNGLPYEEFENLLDGIPALQKVLLLDTCFSGEIEKDQAVVVAQAETGGSGTVKMRSFKAARGVTVVPDASETNSGTPTAPRLSKEMVKFQQDWFADLRRGTGAAVISSSSGNEYSLEGEQWKNGVFTYALINGLKNRGADANKDQTITVSELQSYVIDQVRKLTEGGQNPTVRRENLEYDFAVY